MSLKAFISIFYFIHNLIKLILAIVLSLVYWSLYKIIKEYPWSNHNKTEGFLLAIANKKIIAQTQVFIVLIVVVNKKIIDFFLNNIINNKNIKNEIIAV